MHERSCFLTLTYDDDHLPSDYGLDKSHVQRMFKRMRKAGIRLRYYMCGEYGDRTSRPHYHVAFCGEDFREDMEVWQERPMLLWTSARLASFWPYGRAVVGALDQLSAQYVARYVLKKRTGARERDYMWDDGFGAWERTAEYVAMSRRPGIGASFYEKYRDEIFPRDRVVVNKHERRAPSYYVDLLERENPRMAAVIRERRAEVGEHIEVDQDELDRRYAAVVYAASRKERAVC